MNMKKSIWSVLTIMMVAMLSVGLASCGGSDDDGRGDSSGSGGGGGTNTFSIAGTWRYYFTSNDPSRGEVYNLVTFNSDHTGSLIEEVGYGSDKPDPFTWSQSGNTVVINFNQAGYEIWTIVQVIDNNTVLVSNGKKQFTFYRDGTGGGGSTNIFSIAGTWKYYFTSNDPSRGEVYNLVTFNSDHTGYLIEEVGYGSDKPDPFTWSQSGNTITISFSQSVYEKWTIVQVFDNNTVVVSNGKKQFTFYRDGTGGGGGSTEEDDDIIKNDTINHPETVAYIYDHVASMEGDVIPSRNYCVKGKICSIKYPFSVEYGTAVFNITDNGYTSDKEFTVYNAYYKNFNRKWKAGDTQIAVGDEVVVFGKVVNYKGTTPEFVDRRCCVVYINGK
jgi:hypothetical protein